MPFFKSKKKHEEQKIQPVTNSTTSQESIDEKQQLKMFIEQFITNIDQDAAFKVTYGDFNIKHESKFGVLGSQIIALMLAYVGVVNKSQSIIDALYFIETIIDNSMGKGVNNPKWEFPLKRDELIEIVLAKYEYSQVATWFDNVRNMIEQEIVVDFEFKNRIVSTHASNDNLINLFIAIKIDIKHLIETYNCADGVKQFQIALDAYLTYKNKYQSEPTANDLLKEIS